MSTDDRSKAQLHVACHNVVPGCGFTAGADTEKELIDKVAAHAAEDHGVPELTPELAAKVRAAITRR